MQTPFIAGNWKMFKTVQEAVLFIKELKSAVRDVTGVDIVVAPTFTALHAVAEAARNSNVAVAAQDLYWEKEGAFTGEVSRGDGERSRRNVRHRRTFRAAAALRRDRRDRQSQGRGRDFGGASTPIVCIGETLEEREAGQTFDVLDRQVKDGPRWPDRGTDRRARHRVRTGLGHRHRAERDRRPGGRGACAHPQAAAPVVRRGRRGALPRDLRRQRQA